MESIPDRESQFDVERYLEGVVLGRDETLVVRDAEAVRRYVKDWKMSEEDSLRRKNALETRCYGECGSCPECETAGSFFPAGKVDLLTCDACQTYWVYGSGTFRMWPEEYGLTYEDVERVFRRCREVEPLFGINLEILDKADIGIRKLPLTDIRECAICSYPVLPKDLRELARFLFTEGWVPLLSLGETSPLCAICGDEVDRTLQTVVDAMWGIKEFTEFVSGTAFDEVYF